MDFFTKRRSILTEISNAVAPDAEALAPPGVRAETIARRRSELLWTQQELADRAGITRRTVSRGEAGLHLSPISLRALEKALGMTLPGRHRPQIPTMPRTMLVGAFMRQIRRQTKSIDDDARPGRKWETIEIAAHSLGISPSQLSRLERGQAAPHGLFHVGLPDGEIYGINRSQWISAIYKPFLDDIKNLATGDGSRKGAFRRGEN